MNNVFYDKRGRLIEKSITEKHDTGDTYRSNRYIELDEPDLPEIGKEYMTWLSHYVGPNRDRNHSEHLRFSNDEQMVAEGFPGNSNRNIRRFHGWRGTTDEIHVSATGVRVCEDVLRKEYEKTVHYRITFGPDLTADRD